MADDKVQLNREPYTVKYMDLAGEVKSLRRTPPPKLHDALPQDVVELTRKKNDDFNVGESLEVLSISPRQPNVLRVKNADGQVTFIDALDMRFNVSGDAETALAEEAPTAKRSRESPRDRVMDSRYLVWP